MDKLCGRYRNYLSPIFVLSIIGVGLILRLWNLGEYGFWWDELYHVTAAKSLIADGDLFIPLQGQYTRAFPVTYITAAFFELFGISEIAGRIPFALINVVFLVVSYQVIKGLFSDGVAILFLIVMAFSPFVLDLSRECRMYSSFQLSYFLMAMCFFFGLERRDNKFTVFEEIETKYKVSFAYLFLSLLFFLISLSLHALTYNFAFVVMFYSLIMFFHTWYSDGFRNSLNSKYFAILVLLGLLMFIVLFLYNDTLARLIVVGTTLPEWAVLSKKVSNFSYYRYFLSDNYPALFFIYPLSVLLMVRECREKGIFVFCSFVPLLILHMFFFQRQLERYIFYIFPFFVLGAVYLWHKIIVYVIGCIRDQSVDVSRSFLVVFLLSAVVGFNVFGYPWLANSKNIYDKPYWNEWKTSLSEDLKETLRSGSVITTRHLAYMYYVNDMPNYHLRVVPEYEYVTDVRSNIKVVDNLEKLERVFSDTEEELYLVTTPWTFNTDTIVSEDIREFVLRNTTPVSHNGSRSVLILKKKQ